MTVSVCLCLCAVVFAGQLARAAGGLGVTMEYESKLFDTDQILEINIIMDDADWQSMLDNAINEEYVQCDVQVDGETFYSVGIRPKGNTSLSSIANDPDTDRYSFKLEFDQYVDDQTCFGLDKLILNNNYADATNMKEALIYDMYAYIGADASLYNYAKVSVNGEYWGVYLALEAVEESFMLRNYGTDNGEMYKPDSMNIGGGGGDLGDMPDMCNFDMSDMDFSTMQPPENGGNADAKTEQAPDMGDFDSKMFGGGSNLNYSDNDLDSYSTIWDSEVTNTGDGDHKRVVTALKNISEGTDLEQYMDIDNLLKYAAVHIFSVNSDSLSGMMAHNYYLYETDGQLNILPWDYNLAFGGMGMGGGGSATDTVNSAIDDAWSSTNFFDTLMADETYHAAYYDYMEQVVDYIHNGAFEAFYTHTRSLIDTLVETDPNAFYTYDEYLTAVETLYEVVTLRGESIQGQLDGNIPSTESEQRNSDALIDASHLDLDVMGSMNMGGGFNFDGEMPEDFDPSQFGGQMPGDFGQSSEGENNTTQGETPDIDENNGSSENGQTGQSQQRPDRGNMTDRGNMFGSNSGQMEASSNTLIIYGIASVVMLMAFLFALFYRRKPRKR